jgi:hypothetical protein
MPSQKLKKIALGIVAFLILVTIAWFVYNVFNIGVWEGSIFELADRVSNLSSTSALTSFGIAFILILGLYLIGKILIEIFK